MPPRHWLSRSHPLAVLLRPIAWVFGVLRAVREKLYNWGIFKTHRLPVPVIVIGNVVAGGVGKTPVVIELVQRLQHMGYRPGVVSRGYGRQKSDCHVVTDTSTCSDAGDEPLLIAHACQAPVAVASSRVEAAEALLRAHPECNVLVSDDGLQHLAMARDVEIVIFDERGIGNNWLLPAGPLREPWPRKPRCRAHLVLNHVPKSLAAYALDENGQQYALSSLATQTLYALAGIAKPDSFFTMLRAQGLQLVDCHAYPDHANFAQPKIAKKLTQQLAASPSAIWLCTQKDAVKLWSFFPNDSHRILAIPLVLDLDMTFLSVFDVSVQSLMQTSHS
jgi:tetraacyldisaccharide 4'-kinase